MSNNELTYAEFSRCLGVSAAYVTVNIKRGNIKANVKRKTINYQDAQNKIWIDKQIAGGKTFDLNRKNDVGAKVQERKGSGKNGKSARKNGKSAHTVAPALTEFQKQLQQLELKKKEVDLNKASTEEELKKLEIMKRRGDLVPVDAVKTVFLYSLETTRTLFTQELNSIASIYSEILEADEKTYKQLQKEIMMKVNDVMKTLKDSLKSGLSGVVKEYSETRSRGEKK